MELSMETYFKIMANLKGIV